MNTNFLRCLLFALMSGVLGEGHAIWAQDAQNPPAVPAEELPAGAEVLTGGPVHEAFAKPVSMDPQAPVLVLQQPPENLQEVPPAERPAGANIVWVPGYWAWDADRTDFVWVSGCWRNAPPNTYWVPGYWLQAGNGWEWIGGFWKLISAQPQQEIEYLPAPPAPIEVEAPGAAPQPDQVWVPGCWYWEGGQYVPRHGYWITQQAGWVWVPSHSVWTPRGYIFAQGHWDHDLDDRGVLFCPAFFPRDLRARAGLVFSPGVCIDLGMLRLNLFVYPQYRHYYFGDYYDDVYVRAGILPWFKCQTVHTWYDPLFVYDRWHFQKTDPHWAANLARGFDSRRSHRDLRPARTYQALQAQMNRLPAKRRPERPLVATVQTYAASESTPLKFERITATERQEIAVKAADVHNLRDQRHQWEAPSARPAPVAVARTNPKPGSRMESPKAGEQPRIQPGKGARAPAVIPPEPVRVTQPERVTVASTPRMPKPAESRFIPKVPPGRPSQEQVHGAPAAPPGKPAQARPRQAGAAGREQRR